jgi:hypothetical protein
MRFVVLCFFLMLNCCMAVCAQEQADTVDTIVRPPRRIITPAQAGSGQVLDSVILATVARQKFIQDSVALQYIKYPDSNVIGQAAQQFIKDHMYKGFQFLDIPFKSKSNLRNGHTRQTRDQWIIIIIIGLLIYSAVLNIVLHRDIRNVFLSFYSKRALVQASKDDAQINFWAFTGLFLLFGLTFGLFLYQLAAYRGIYYSVSGFRLFTSFVVIILLLFAVKFLVLKFVGFVFDIQKLVTEYVSVLYLTYFNIAFVFLPVTVCFSLLAAPFIPVLLTVAVVLIVIILTWLYLRSSVNIISNFRFHKFYLFIYLCALEICPILILIKALNI